MKRLTFTILTILTIGQVFGQTDENGNPVCNSVSTSEKLFNDFLLISNYYTLKNNIENRASSVFISESPTLDQIEEAAIKLQSDFFILTKKSKVVVMIILLNYPKQEFMTIVIANNKQTTSSCKLSGDITENRANEILKEKYDPTAKIENNILTFNNKNFQIITNKEIEEAVFELIKKEKLDKKKPSNIAIPSKSELQGYILSETKKGGKLDFFTEIQGKEFDGVQIKPGLFTTKQSVALYKWGRACFDLGVNIVDDAYEIFAKFKGKPVNEREKEYIRKGFFKEWEK